MGMFSEIAAEQEAKGLQKVLVNAIKTRDIAIICFCKEEIFPLYMNVLGESYSTELSNSDEYTLIIKTFYDKN